MDNSLHLSVSPHIHSGRSTSRIMLDVLIALSPAAIAGTIIFGFRSLLVILACVASCVAFEFLFNLVTKRRQTIGDLSAAVTGLLLALNLPANIPIWQCVIGSAFAILLVKCIFGGIGANLVNPAITARVFMIIAFGATMASVATPVIVDTVAGATPLVDIAAGNTPSLMSLLLGTTGGAIGETCAIALIAGFVYLLVRRVITWHVPVAFVGTVFIFSFFMEGGWDFATVSAQILSGEILAEGSCLMNATALILSGGLLIGAIFMATDYVTSPATAWGKVIFGLGCGVLTFLIREFGSYPEGVSFAILLMNIVNPYIESLTSHKVFGGVKA